MPGQLFEIQPEQLDALIADLDGKTPPKQQTRFSTKEVIGLLYEFITRSLENHYAYDELAPMIQESLVSLKITTEMPEMKGSTLKQYYLEIKRERESVSSRRASAKASRKRSAAAKKMTVKTTEKQLDQSASEISEKSASVNGNSEQQSKSSTRQLPRPDSSSIKLAY